MKHTFKARMAFFVLCLVLITSMLCTPVLALSAASKERVDTSEEDSFVPWEISETGDSLYDGTRYLYSCGNFPLGIYHDPDAVYISAEEVLLPFLSPADSQNDDGDEDDDYQYYSYVYATSPQSDLVWLIFEDTAYYYATKEKLAELKQYLNGKSADFRIQKGEQIASFTKDDLTSVLKYVYSDDAKRITTGVTTLASVPRIEVLMRDKSGSLSYVYATIYCMNGHYYFVDHTQLDNSYFDANGNFSYRTGTIDVVPLMGDAKTLVSNAEAALTDREIVHTYEDDTLHEPVAYPIVFWIFLVFFGFLIPMPLLIVGLVLPHSSKRGYPKYWYRLAICAGVWLVLSIAITVILTILQN